MEELSWQAKLARSNINILDIHDSLIFLEFTYHPKPGTFKWVKTVLPFSSVRESVPVILEQVLALRKELEG